VDYVQPVAATERTLRKAGSVMKKLSLTIIAILVGTCTFIDTAYAQQSDHQMTTPDELK
jgi:hypothetical protein